MKRFFSLLLAVVFALALCLPAFAAPAEDSIIYSIPEDEVTDDMRDFWREATRTYPGLKTIPPDEVDPSLPVIEFDSEADFEAFMNNLDSSRIYSKEPAARSSYDGAKPYEQNNSTSVNCYEYAGEFYWFISPDLRLPC